MSGGGSENSDDEFVQAVPPVNLNEPPDEPSGPIGQIAEGLWESAADAVKGTVQLAVDSAKAAYDVATTDEGKEAAWETAKSMLKDAGSFAKDAFSQTPIAPQEWQDDVDRRFDEWVNEKADAFEKDWQDAKDRGEEIKFVTKKIGWAVIGLITKKVAPKVCVKCPTKRRMRTKSAKPKPNTKSFDYYDPETGTYPNSPFEDKKTSPKKILQDIEDRQKKAAQEALNSEDLAKENARIQKLHDKYIETGEWEFDGLDDHQFPDESLREKYLENNPEKKK